MLYQCDCAVYFPIISAHRIVITFVIRTHKARNSFLTCNYNTINMGISILHKTLLALLASVNPLQK